MKNRGPDNYGLFSENIGNDKCIKLLHSRLSIIDLTSKANQPLTSDGSTLIFNGEIYNYLELKDDLEKYNYKFTTNSDTEVLLKSYLRYGEKCVKYFNGMFFAIWDSNCFYQEISLEKNHYFIMKQKIVILVQKLNCSKSFSKKIRN